MSYFTKTLRKESIYGFFLIQVNLIMYILMTSISISEAQAPSIQWENTYLGNSSDYVKSMKQNADGGFILGSYSNSGIGGDKSQFSKGGGDYWLIKTDALGNKLWDKTIGGNSLDQTACILNTSDGGYLVGGYSNSAISGDKSEASRGNYDYWIVKLDASGNKIWDKTYGGSLFDNLTTMAKTMDGGYILGGYSNSGTSGEKSQINKGLNDYWIIRINGSGAMIWERSFGGSGEDNLESLIQTMEGGFILGGYSSSGISGDKSEVNRGGGDYWIIKLDSSGNKLWDRTIGGNGSDHLYAIAQLPDGNCVLGGESLSNLSGDKSQNNKGSSDYWIVKVDVSGNKLWDKTIGGTSSEFFAAMDLTSDNGFILGGYSISNSGLDKSENNKGAEDYWVVKLDVLGNKLWDKTLGGSSFDFLFSIIQCSDGGFALGGRSHSNASGDKSENSSGGLDGWVIRLAPDTTLTDTIAPDILNLPDTIYVSNDHGFCSAKVSWLDPEVTDEGGVAFIQSDYSSGDTFPVGATTVTYAAQDSSGNTAMASFVIVVTDNEAPVVATQNITIYLNDSGYAEITAMDIENGSTDNCGIAGFRLSRYRFDCSSPGQDSVQLTVTDIYGNEASAGAAVIVVDNLSPEWVTSSGSLDRQIYCGDSAGLAEAQGLSPVATDNCGMVTLFKTIGNLMGNTYTNTWLGLDPSGNPGELFTQVIALINLSVDASASSNPVELGTAALLSAQVYPVIAGIEVNFYLDEILAGTALTNGSGTAQLSVAGLPAGVYKIRALLGGGCAESIAYLPVYDPYGGFVTGGGWIQSPAGAYLADPSLNGKANFGFVSKYKKGSNEVDGNTEFRFQTGNLNFKSSSHTAASLVIAGAKAIYKGIGTVNGSGSYGFMVSAIDGQVNSGGNADKFRIKIWDKNNGNGVIYDNQLGVDENADPSTLLGGGSIVIHKPKNGQNLGYSTPGTGLKINAGHSIRLEAYPNPMQNRLNLRIDNPDNHPVKIDLIHITGRLMPIKVREVSNLFYQMDVTDLPVGVYSLQVQAGHSVQFVKVLKQE